VSFLKNIFAKIGLGANSASETIVDDKEIIEDKKVLVNHVYLEDLEEKLIKTDLGVDLSLEYSKLIEEKYLAQDIKQSILEQELKDFLLRSFDENSLNKVKLDKNKKNIFLIVGVNGVGKTTSIGKLASKFKKQGFNTLIAAADTFRAAAEEQLALWSKRADVDIVQLEDGAKASTVVFKAIEKTKAENYNMLLIDTAGRLQNKKDLMAELKKLNDVVTKNLADANFALQTLLVLDATTGSNAISQVENFNDVTKLDGIILTKFDGTAKAGMIFTLARKFKLPVFYVGTGESIDDIKEFSFENFVSKYFQ
jgi:fused signal recognition particle receptor